MFVSSSLIVLAGAYTGGVSRLWRTAGIGQGVSRAQATCFAAGWLALVVALLSPLDAWSDELFSAHMVQHELLMVVAAPLIAASSTLVAVLWLFPFQLRRSLSGAMRNPVFAASAALLTAPSVVWVLHGVALWLWHVPLLWQAALESEVVHAFQHLSFFCTAVLFWWGLEHGRYGRTGYGVAVVYVFATALHSGVLGALLTFSPTVWYPAYVRTTTAFGLSPLEDQQLAGVLMWIPAGLVFIAGGLYFFAAWLRESERRSRVPLAAR